MILPILMTSQNRIFYSQVRDVNAVLLRVWVIMRIRTPHKERVFQRNMGKEGKPETSARKGSHRLAGT